MIFVIAASVGLVIAALRGIPLRGIAERRFHGIASLIFAAGIHVLLSPLVMPAEFATRLASSPLSGGPLLGSLIYLVSLLGALAFLSINRRLPGFSLILLGLTLNFVVIAANGGQMPGDPSQLERAGLLAGFLKTRETGLWSPFTLIDDGTLLPFLADVIFLPMPFRAPTVASIGDFVIALGVFGFFCPLIPRRSPLVPHRSDRSV